MHSGIFLEKGEGLDSFVLNRKNYTTEDILRNELNAGDYSKFEYGAISTIRNWYQGQQSFTFTTSGSTGKPKTISFRRDQIVNSARRTIDAFELRPGQTLLCCLNIDFVAGFMMIIRAIVGGMKLIIEEPKLNPLDGLEDEQFDFMALTPVQADTVLRERPSGFRQTQKILLGGAAIHPELEISLKDHSPEVFHSYGMTETLTHVAIRNVSKGEQAYAALEHVTFAKDADGRLVISDTALEIDGLLTNDIVQLVDEKTFTWLGRADNVINSGGIKIRIEELEVRIVDVLIKYGIRCNVCLIPKEDRKLTNKIILLVEFSAAFEAEELKDILKATLPKYHAPKEVVAVPELFYTDSGKIDRLKNSSVYL
jgi:O-succinylbenzoic acid--CoA ligase